MNKRRCKKTLKKAKEIAGKSPKTPRLTSQERQLIKEKFGIVKEEDFGMIRLVEALIKIQ